MRHPPVLRRIMTSIGMRLFARGGPVLGLLVVAIALPAGAALKRPGVDPLDLPQP